MGCTFAHPRPHGESTRHLFKVLNMDKDGIERNPGKIEITESELVFHQKQKEPIVWPLRSLRRYGFDAELFSFESGRRCPTGPGIYAFKCSRAEALFNLLQECIQRAGQQEDMSPRSGATQRPMSVSDLHGGGDANQRNTNTVPHLVNNNINSVHTPNGVVTLQVFPQISDSRHEYVNANCLPNGAPNTAAVDSISTSNVAIDLSRQVSLQSEAEPQIQYAELDLRQDGVASSAPGGSSQPPLMSNGDSSQGAIYMNLAGSKARPSLSSSVPLIDAPLPPVPEENTAENSNYLNAVTTPNGNAPKVMYIEVDFKHNEQDGGRGLVTNGHVQSERTNDSALAAQSSPPAQSYAVIDFHKTAAINAKNINHAEDGDRKTRHS